MFKDDELEKMIEDKSDWLLNDDKEMFKNWTINDTTAQWGALCPITQKSYK